MTPLTKIAVWCAVGTMISAAGKFLDDFHITTQTKGKVRDLLIRAFVVVEEGIPFENPLPNRNDAREALAFIETRWREIVRLFLFMALCGTAMSLVSPIAIAGAVIGVFGSVTILSLKGCLILLHTYRRVEGFAKKAMLVLAIAVTGMLSTATVLVVLFAGVIMSLASALNYRIVLWLLLSTLQCAISTTKALLVRILDAASDPKTSPFIYASSLLGLFVAILGIVKALLSRHP